MSNRFFCFKVTYPTVSNHVKAAHRLPISHSRAKTHCQWQYYIFTDYAVTNTNNQKRHLANFTREKCVAHQSGSEIVLLKITLIVQRGPQTLMRKLC